MSFKLYELSEIYMNIWDLVGDEDVDLVSLEKALTDVEDKLSDKAENIAKLIKSIEAHNDGIKAEEVRLAKKRKTLESKKDYFKSYLESQLKAIGKDKIEGQLFNVRLQKNPPSVNVLNESAIPEKYWNVVTTKTLNRKSILDDLKAKIEVKGAEIKQEKSLRID